MQGKGIRGIEEKEREKILTILMTRDPRLLNEKGY